MINKDELLRKALEKQYPIPDSPHTSVVQNNADKRIAFQEGYETAVADEAIHHLAQLQFSPEPGVWRACTASMYDKAPEYGYKRRVIKVISED
jgi:hypothetical protein